MKLVLTRREAVLAQIDGAIQAYLAGDHACAVTLAGAAEGAMPPASNKTVFEAARDAFEGRPDWFPGGKKEVIGYLNAERDWLKHYSPEMPAAMDFSGSHLMILRAVSRLHESYGRQAESETIKAFFAEARRFGPDD